jgi:hypothetical protein
MPDFYFSLGWGQGPHTIETAVGPIVWDTEGLALCVAPTMEEAVKVVESVVGPCYSNVYPASEVNEEFFTFFPKRTVIDLSE